jgi:hypothetical protein
MVQTNGETRPQKSTLAAQRLLSALADMASSSTRVQADLGAAMRQAKLLLGADQIVAALAELVRAARRRAAFDQIIMIARGKA